MSKHDASRREFLKHAAVGAGAAAGAGLVTAVPAAIAQDSMEHMEGGSSAPGQQHPTGAEHGAFFNHADAATMSAITERLMPSAPGKPGARDADVLNYIDLALSGAYADQQDFYRRGLAALDAYCHSTYKAPFVQLNESQQNEVIAALESDKATGFSWPSGKQFFNVVWIHTMEGMFADPIYGGNRDFAGWKLVGFPGAQAIFTPTDLQDTQAFTRAPMVGLQASSKTPVRG